LSAWWVFTGNSDRSNDRAWCYATLRFSAQVSRPTDASRRDPEKAGKINPRDFIMMSPDEPTPAMQNPEKDPQDWTTGEEPMTGPQRSYLQTLCREAGEEFDANLTKAAASKKIEELQEKTGRGKK
jgi:hypothetical protein